MKPESYESNRAIELRKHKNKEERTHCRWSRWVGTVCVLATTDRASCWRGRAARTGRRDAVHRSRQRAAVHWARRSRASSPHPAETHRPALLTRSLRAMLVGEQPCILFTRDDTLHYDLYMRWEMGVGWFLFLSIMHQLKMRDSLKTVYNDRGD